MAKLVHLFLIALIVGAFVIPQEADAFIFKKLLKKALFAKKALLAPKLLLAKKALPLLALKAKKVLPLALKAKKLIPLAVGAKLLASRRVGSTAVRTNNIAQLPAYNTWTRASYAMPSVQYTAPAMTQVSKTFQQGIKA